MEQFNHRERMELKEKHFLTQRPPRTLRWKERLRPSRSSRETFPSLRSLCSLWLEKPSLRISAALCVSAFQFPSDFPRLGVRIASCSLSRSGVRYFNRLPRGKAGL